MVFGRNVPRVRAYRRTSSPKTAQLSVVARSPTRLPQSILVDKVQEVAVQHDVFRMRLGWDGAGGFIYALSWRSGISELLEDQIDSPTRTGLSCGWCSAEILAEKHQARRVRDRPNSRRANRAFLPRSRGPDIAGLCIIQG
jgi:hypothetical protein